MTQLGEFSRFENINYLFWSAKLLGFFTSSVAGRVVQMGPAGGRGDV